MTRTGLKIIIGFIVFVTVLPSVSYAQTQPTKKPDTKNTTKQVEPSEPKRDNKQKPATKSQKTDDIFSRAQEEISKGKVCGEKPQPVS